MVYADLKNINQVINIDEELFDVIGLKLFSVKDSVCMFVSSQNKYTELNLKEVNDKVLLESNHET